ncbi:MAG: hypothetical protein IJW73_08150 [Candidatus Gastranaerophilales bacterium]|nr:hypothetical protein [Candidatus Gastranaerophilales bacterium]
MTISNISGNNFNYDLYKSQQAVSFGGLTAKGAGIPVDSYHQASVQQGMPSTLPTSYGFIPSTDDMEMADKFAQLGVNGVDNPFGVNKVAQAENAYKPTGTGELSPVLEGREDEIEDCPWKEYYA